MKIDLQSIDTESFILKEGFIGGKMVTLINPKEFGCSWTKDTLHLRSVIVDFDGNILSRGFNKFFNYSEKPDLYPNPMDYKDWVFAAKEDGSLICCDYIYDVLNVRTRGTINYTSMQNKDDFDYVLGKYAIYNIVSTYPEYTFLFELYSPNHIIVLKPYDTPEIVFLGAIHKETGVYSPFYSEFGKTIVDKLSCKVPEVFSMNGDIMLIANVIKKWEKKEGVVLNYNNNRNMVKMKSDWYLLRHMLKSKLNSIDNLVDMFFNLENKDYNSFFNNIVETVDFETATELQGKISNIVDGYRDVNKIITGMLRFVEKHKQLPRKDFASIVFSSYGGEGNNRASFIFTLLDRGELNNEQKKKLLYQCIKI